MTISAATMLLQLALLAGVGILAHALAKFVVLGYGAWAGWFMTGVLLVFYKWFGDKYDI